jgi:hypothetical protein
LFTENVRKSIAIIAGGLKAASMLLERGINNLNRIDLPGGKVYEASYQPLPLTVLKIGFKTSRRFWKSYQHLRKPSGRYEKKDAAYARLGLIA